MDTRGRKWLAPSLIGLVFAIAIVPAAQAQVTLQGRVVSVDGTPLQGDVTLVRGAPDVEIRSYRTDRHGAFTIQADRAAGLLLVAKAGGHISSEIELDTTGSRVRLEVAIQLWPAGRVRGRVVDGSGRGLPGATVQVRYPGARRRYRFGQESGDVQADDFGYFVLPFVARGKPFVIDAATTDRLPGSTALLTLQDPEQWGFQVTAGRVGHVIRGKVRDSAGGPHGGATVRLRLSPIPKNLGATGVSRLLLRSLNQRTVTGPDGAYEFRGLPAGKATVIAQVPNKTPTRQQQVLPELGSSLRHHWIAFFVD